MPEPATAPTCPPHHWLIEGYEREQQWTCTRCGVERKPPLAPETGERAQWGHNNRRAPKAPVEGDDAEAGSG
jgi:hypothetical protein